MLYLGTFLTNLLIMKNYIFYLIVFFGLISCGENNNSVSPTNNSPSTVDMSLYQERSVKGTNWTLVSRNHPNGELYEKGFMENGIKTGTWTTFYPDNGYIQTITNYENGNLVGPYIEFDERGRINKHIDYENNVMSGLYGEYKNGRPVRKIMYYDGKINGFVREYNNKSKVIKEAYYRDNVLDGKVSHYNDEGTLIMEYIYEDGEKVSGGIVE